MALLLFGFIHLDPLSILKWHDACIREVAGYFFSHFFRFLTGSIFSHKIVI